MTFDMFKRVNEPVTVTIKLTHEQAEDVLSLATLQGVRPEIIISQYVIIGIDKALTEKEVINGSYD